VFGVRQLDSWWYPKDILKGVTLWEPMSSVFPSGMSHWLGEPLLLHNRWFSPENEYITSGNFSSSFIVEEVAALPIKPDVFTHLMAKAKAWGMFLYEQDWLSFVYRQMLAPRNNVYHAHDWLKAMGDAARGLDLSVQYCMPLPSHVLQSTKIQPVTEIRASDDYRPGRTFPPNWQVAHTSMLIWAVGAVPFKDDFWFVWCHVFVCLCACGFSRLLYVGTTGRRTRFSGTARTLTVLAVSSPTPACKPSLVQSPPDPSPRPTRSALRYLLPLILLRLP
jgi:hypothetical protein